MLQACGERKWRPRDFLKFGVRFLAWRHSNGKMTTSSDSELLREWLDGRSEAAFELLVGRYAGLVQMAALRAGCDAATAAEASQLTFITLAKKARSLASRQSLGGWLYLTAMLQAKNALSLQRHELRKREEFRTHMDTREDPSTGTWQRMQPLLNDAMKALSEGDREMLLLRFYRSLSIGEIGALLGIATEAAQKRVNRATERLRKQFERRGCRTGDAFCPALMAGLGAEAQLGGLVVPALSTKAIAASTTAGGSAAMPALALMISTKKSAIAAGTLLLLAGAVGVAIVANDRDPANGSGRAEVGPGKNTTSAFTPGGSKKEVEAGGSEAADAKTASLVESYGEDRTKQSKRVALEMLGFAEEMRVAQGIGDPDLKGLRSMLGKTYEELRLSPEQEAGMREVYRRAMHERWERAGREFQQLAGKPAALMELILASDAAARGEMKPEEFQRMGENAEHGARMAAHLPGMYIDPDMLSEDPAFRKAMAGVLEASQAAIFEDSFKGMTWRPVPLPLSHLEQREKELRTGRQLIQAMRELEEAGE